MNEFENSTFFTLRCANNVQQKLKSTQDCFATLINPKASLLFETTTTAQLIMDDPLKQAEPSTTINVAAEDLSMKQTNCLHCFKPLGSDVKNDTRSLCEKCASHETKQPQRQQLTNSLSKGASTLRRMKLWNRMFKSSREFEKKGGESKCNQIQDEKPGFSYFGFYGSIRRRVNGKNGNANHKKGDTRIPSTLEILEEQQKRLAAIAATPRMTRALNNAVRTVVTGVQDTTADAFGVKPTPVRPADDNTQSGVNDSLSIVQQRTETNRNNDDTLATSNVCSPQLSKHCTQAKVTTACQLATVSEVTELPISINPTHQLPDVHCSSTVNCTCTCDLITTSTRPPPFKLAEKQLADKLHGIFSFGQRLRASGVFGTEIVQRYRHSPANLHSHCSLPASPYMNERKRSPMRLERNSRRSSQESLLSLMSNNSSSVNSYVNYKPCCQQAHRGHRGPSSVGGGSSRSSLLTESSYEANCRHKARPRSTKQLAVQACGTSPLLASAACCADVKPMAFELPVVDRDETFLVSRQWLFHELKEILVYPYCENGMKGAVLYGLSGTGKTTVLHQLAAACPLQAPVRCLNNVDSTTAYESPSQNSHSQVTSASSDSGFLSTRSKVNHSSGCGAVVSAEDGRPGWLRDVADSVVAYHFCQLDNEITCSLPEFLYNLATMIALSPTMSPYAELIAAEPDLQKLFDKVKFYESPLQTFRRLVSEPLQRLHRLGKLKRTLATDNEAVGRNFLILIDALDEAHFHRPDSTDSISSFLLAHGQQLLPACFRLVLSVHSDWLQLVKGLPLHKIDLNCTTDDRLHHDSLQYVKRRLDSCLAIQNNVSCKAASLDWSWSSSGGSILDRFAEHLVTVAKGCFLYLKLVLDLIQQNYIVVKGTNYRLLPINLSEVFTLMLSLKFPTERSYRQVAPVLEAVLASRRPLTAEQLYTVCCATELIPQLKWDQFRDQLTQLREFLISTRTGTFVCFHPAFRQWLISREQGSSTRFLCDVKRGHASIALWLTRRCSEKSLGAEDLQELGHHLLKAHIYKNVQRPDCILNECQLFWLNHSAVDIKSSLCSTRNIFQPNTKVSKLLLLAGADPNCKTNHFHGAPLLCVACRQGLYQFATLLLEFNADVNAVDENMLSPLMHAAIGGNLDLIQMLHEHGALINQLDRENKCALVHAAENGQVEVVSFLLQCDWAPCKSSNASGGYPITSKSQIIQQAFVMAAAVGQISVCKFLLDFCDAHIDTCDLVTGETALSMACSYGNKDTVHYLLQNNAQVSLGRSEHPTPPLLQAVQNGCWEIVSALLTTGVDVDNEVNSTGMTALMLAAQCGHIGVMELLLGRDASVNITDDNDRNALCWACIGAQTSCVGLLLDRGAKLNEADRLGNMPIHYAAQYGCKTLLQLLIDRGATLERANKQGFRPLEVSIDADNVDTFQRLLRRGAKLGPATWTRTVGKPRFTVLLLEKLVQDGYLLYKKGRLKDAAHRFSYALKKVPGNVVDKLSSSVGDTSADTGTKLQELSYHLTLGLARCGRKAGNLEQAVQLAGEAIQLDPDRFEAYFVRARCQCEAKRWIAARSDFQKALRLCPDNREISDSLIRLQNYIDQKKPEASSSSSSAAGQQQQQQQQQPKPSSADDGKIYAQSRSAAVVNNNCSTSCCSASSAAAAASFVADQRKTLDNGHCRTATGRPTTTTSYTQRPSHCSAAAAAAAGSAAFTSGVETELKEKISFFSELNEID
ncbi:Protein TANC2 [Trichinella papuae]|uniref:Protein TANC2 n=2 Tax=Trichinella papuae TaxID=268474 RepID=A0A0V1N2I1_9BILA|nr:Protein TANC2 [Trichinella papuae]